MIAKEINNKLIAARTKLILDKPFLGVLVLRLPMVEADPKWCQTVATDARCFYYNPHYVAALSSEQTQFVLAHEALHCGLSHFARRQHRQKQRWDLACDYAINPLLLQDGLSPPPGVLIFDEHEGMTAEEIYPLIDENNDDKPMDKHVYDEQQNSQPNQVALPSTQQSDPNNTGGQQIQKTQPPPLSETEKQTLAVQWQQRLVGAAQQAFQAGKLQGAMARIVDHFLQPQLPWQALLASYLSMTAKDDYTYMRPSRREGNAIYPSLRSGQINIVIVLDISGSISNAEIKAFLSEINALKGQLRATIALFACDDKLTEDSPWFYEPWEDFSAPKQFKGGGGTDFRPAFDYLNKLGQTPELLIYFTDAQGVFPQEPNHYPVIWLVKGKSKVPWGKVVYL